jgi:glucan phosphoethanolaminetransferase (alkaline phosphatase superfamily)
MPVRAYRASAAYAGAHISANTWLWIIAFAGITAVMWVLNWMDPHSGIWSHLVVLSAMVCSTLVMIQSQVGFVSPYAPKDDEVEVVTPPVPRA